MSDIKSKYKYVVKKIDGDEYVDQTYIGLTEAAGRYQGVIYSYGKVSVPQESQQNSDGTLPFRFEYDIVDNNGWKQEDFKEDFFELIGDILVDIITTEEPYIDNNRTDSTI
tara:strand:- start:610 stop:942 length:333 start_codon:yes stop_codon:yes gene_type:complete